MNLIGAAYCTPPDCWPGTCGGRQEDDEDQEQEEETTRTRSDGIGGREILKGRKGGQKENDCKDDEEDYVKDENEEEEKTKQQFTTKTEMQETE